MPGRGVKTKAKEMRIKEEKREKGKGKREKGKEDEKRDTTWRREKGGKGRKEERLIYHETLEVLLVQQRRPRVKFPPSDVSR